MPSHIEITQESDVVRIAAKDSGSLESLSKFDCDTAVHVAALNARRLGIVSIQRRRDGELHDGPRGVPAVMEFHAHGSIKKREHWQDGLRSSPDGKNQEPSVVSKHENGTTESIQHWHGGKLNDPPDGSPALQRFTDRGVLEVVAYYSDSMVNDGPNGEPAARHFYPVSGALAQEFRHSQGKLNDGPNGEPAFMEWDTNGTLIAASRFGDGRLIGKLTATELLSASTQHSLRKGPPSPKPPALG